MESQITLALYVFVAFGVLGGFYLMIVNVMTGFSHTRRDINEKRWALEKMSFAQRIEILNKNLGLAVKEFDKVLGEMGRVASDRNLALTKLETQLTELSNKENEMKTKIGNLEKISIPALEYFLQETEKTEKRSARRDYLLFIGGAIVGAIVNIVLILLFGN